MNEPSRIDKLVRNPLVAAVVALGSIVLTTKCNETANQVYGTLSSTPDVGAKNEHELPIHNEKSNIDRSDLTPTQINVGQTVESNEPESEEPTLKDTCERVTTSENPVELIETIKELREFTAEDDIDAFHDPIRMLAVCADQKFIAEDGIKPIMHRLGLAIQDGDTEVAALVGNSIEIECVNRQSEALTARVSHIIDALKRCNATGECANDEQRKADDEKEAKIAGGCRNDIAQKYFDVDFNEIDMMQATKVALDLRTGVDTLMNSPQSCDEECVTNFAMAMTPLIRNQDNSVFFDELGITEEQFLDQYGVQPLAALNAMPKPLPDHLSKLQVMLTALPRYWNTARGKE